MSGQWKPGDVAMAYDADWEFRVVRHGGQSDYWSAADGMWPPGVSADLLDYRPLVVIDAEDREQAARLIAAFSDQFTSWSTDGARDAEKMQAALRSLIAPPKPEEPLGLGAVVEDRQGEQWSRVRSHPEGRRCWQRDSDAVTPVQYRDIDAVRILSGGVA